MSNEIVSLGYEIISPCEKCISWGIDFNSSEPYVCLPTGYHSWSSATLINGGCPYKREVEVNEIK